MKPERRRKAAPSAIRKEPVSANSDSIDIGSKSDKQELPFGISREGFALLATHFLERQSAPAYEKSLPEEAGEETSTPHSESAAYRSSTTLKWAARQALKLLTACEEVTSEYRTHLQKEKDEQAECGKIEPIPRFCVFEKGLRLIDPKGRGPKEREQRYLAFLKSQISKGRIKEADASAVLKREKVEGFQRHKLLQRERLFAEWLKMDVTKTRRLAGVKGGRSPKSS